MYKKFAPSGGGLWVGNGVQSLAAGLATLPFAFAFENVSGVVMASRTCAVMPPNQTAVRRTGRFIASRNSANGISASNGMAMMSFDGENRTRRVPADGFSDAARNQ